MINATNNTDKQRSVGGKVLYPGESRPIEEDQVNEAVKKGLTVTGIDVSGIKKPEQKKPTLEDLRANPIRVIEEKLDSLSNEEILKLEELEKAADDPRESLLKILEKEIERR